MSKAFDGQMTASEMMEAALAAGAALQPPWAKVAAFLLIMLQAAGVAALGVALSFIWLGEGTASTVAAIGSVALGFLVAYTLPQLNHRMIFARVVAGPFAQGLMLSAGPDGVTHANGRSEWRTDWRDVTHVLDTKRSIAIVTSGVSLPVAKRHLDDPAATLAQLRAWHEAVR